MDDWTAQLDSGGQVDVIYTDFAKAFDTVPHQRLHPRTVVITRELSVTKKTVIDWSSFCREVCQFWLEERLRFWVGRTL